MRQKDKIVKALVLAVLLLFGLLIVACGRGGVQGKETSEQAATSGSQQGGEGAYKITIVGGSAGGMWSIITEGVAESIRRGLPNARVTTEPGKDAPNAVVVANKEVEFAVIHEATAYAATQGAEPYDRKYPDVRGVAVLNPTPAFQFFIDTNTGIESFEQIKEKKYPLRVGVNEKGSLMEVSARKVFEAYGITYDDIQKWGGKVHFVRAAQSLELWDAGQLDATSEVAQFPLSAYVEHGTKHKLRLLALPEDKINELSKALGMTKITIPANTYPFQKEDITTLSTKLILITSTQQPADMVYDVVKAMNANLEYLRTVHQNLKDLTPEIMANMNIELHPGASRFYQEIGVIKK